MPGSGFPFVLEEARAGEERALPALQARFLKPPAALAGCIREIALVSNRARSLQTAPTSGALLAFRLSGGVTMDGAEIPALSLTGLQTCERRHAYCGETLSVLVRFTAQGVRSLGVAPRALTDTISSASDLPSAPVLARLHGQLLEATDADQILSAVEAAFQALPFQPDPLVERARLLLMAAPAPRIGAVAARLGVSERQLERRFVKAVGVGPKRFASLLRFERVLPVIDTEAGFAHVAQRGGYCDQSHLTREIVQLTGAAPARLRAQQRQTRDQVMMSDSSKPEC